MYNVLNMYIVECFRYGYDFFIFFYKNKFIYNVVEI